jgi:HPt (histidine-containing phosphotransfer) domain-containing protein
MKGDRELCLKAGMDGYVSKPINSRELELAIAHVTHGLGTVAQQGGTKERLESSPVEPAALNVEQILDWLGGDEKLLHEVIQIFIDEAPKSLDMLRRALGQGDADALEKIAHSMKGELGYLGISEVSQKARELEELGRKHDLEQALRIFPSFEAEISAIVEAMRRANAQDLLAASSGGGQ